MPFRSLLDRPRLVDVAVAFLAVSSAVGIVIGFALVGDGPTPTVLSYLLALVGGFAVLARRERPLTALGVVVAARLTMSWTGGLESALVPAAMIVLFTVARSGDRRVSLGVSSIVAICMTIVVSVLDSDPFIFEFLGGSAQMLLPIAVGEAARSRADRIQDLIDTEAQSRVQAERMRIARDLHDVVAHGLSTIAIQSGVAAHLLAEDPKQAKEALDIINTTGKESLEELRTMVGVLRSDEEVPLRPTPADPNDLHDLIEGASNAGIAVTTDIEGTFPSDAGDSCVVAVHRIIQEALTNVARHAGAAPTHIGLRHGTHNVELTVVNKAGDTSTAVVASTGVGIIGMKERAETLGGSLTASPEPSGGFAVRATIPYNLRK